MKQVYDGLEGANEILARDRKAWVERNWSLYKDTSDKNGNGECPR